jgi:hypothetical protein
LKRACARLIDLSGGSGSEPEGKGITLRAWYCVMPREAGRDGLPVAAIGLVIPKWRPVTLPTPGRELDTGQAAADAVERP